MAAKATISVVFGGPEFSDEYPINQKLKQVVHNVLKEAGRAQEDPSAWELKDVDGRVLNQDDTIEAAGLAGGARLHLVAPAGEGG